jgi:hypothetical protein
MILVAYDNMVTPMYSVLAMVVVVDHFRMKWWALRIKNIVSSGRLAYTFFDPYA